MRNLTRFYNTKSALKKVNASQPIRITPKLLSVLLTIHFQAHYKRPQTFNAIRLAMEDQSMPLRWEHLLDCFTRLIAASYVIKTGSSYLLTDEGRIFLNNLEQKLRKERFDK